MAIPFLLLATPRAGELNHRFLCSRGAGLTDETAWAWINAATKCLTGDGNVAIGPDFVAVIQRNVSQVLGGRKGEEVLLLGGIDTAVANVADVKGKLLARVPELKGIATGIAPSAKGVLIDSGELTQWLASDYSDIRPISAWKSVPTLQSSGSKTLRHIVAGLVLLAGSAGLGATLYNLFQVPETPSSAPNQSDSPTLDAASQTPRHAALEVLKDLVQAIQDDPHGRSKELEEIVVRGKPASELASCFDKQSDPVALLRMLKPNLDDANVLVDALELKAPVPSREIIEWRKYLQSWRAVLGKLSYSSGKAGLRVGDEKLKNLPLLQFLAELTEPRYCCLVDPHVITRPPVLPIFTEKDQETVTALRELLCNSQSGKDFLARLGMPREQHRLLLVLRNLHTSDVAETLFYMGEKEIRRFETPERNSIILRKDLEPQIRAFSEFLEQTPMVEVVRGTKINTDE